jgi:hypothetical protein
MLELRKSEIVVWFVESSKIKHIRWSKTKLTCLSSCLGLVILNWDFQGAGPCRESLRFGATILRPHPFMPPAYKPLLQRRTFHQIQVNLRSCYWRTGARSIICVIEEKCSLFITGGAWCGLPFNLSSFCRHRGDRFSLFENSQPIAILAKLDRSLTWDSQDYFDPMPVSPGAPSSPAGNHDYLREKKMKPGTAGDGCAWGFKYGQCLVTLSVGANKRAKLQGFYLAGWWLSCSIK